MSEQSAVPSGAVVQNPHGSGVRARPDRPRAPRKALISANVLIGAAASLIVLALVMFGVFWIAANTQVNVPKLTGQTESIAQVRLAELGLEVKVTERPFSTLPKGVVLDQTPSTGERLRKGEAVRLVVSGGAEEFGLPDVVGTPVTVASSRLGQRGLQTRLVEEGSDQPKGTVLAMSPQPGSPVRTGDVVVLTVARSGPADPGLRSYSMQGRLFVVDPVPSKTKSGSDVTLEVARRLQALLEASGASTQSTRSVVDATAADKVRAKRVGELSSDAVIVLSVTKSGSSPRIIRIPSVADPADLASSRRLASSLSQALGSPAKPVAITSIMPGPVMKAANGAVAEVSLGSLASQSDGANFRDPNWADETARAIYDALGGLYSK